MIFLAVADRVDPLVYSHNIRDRFGFVDCVLGLGDLDIAYYEYIVTCLNKPLYFVFGNHNLKNLSFFRPKPNCFPTGTWQDADYPGFGSVCIDGKVVRDRKLNLIIAGLGGSRRYNRGQHQFTEIQMFFRTLLLLPRLTLHRILHGRWLDVLLTHAAPSGIHDREDRCHKGFRTFLWFMKVFKPQYLIHGHVHLYDLNAHRERRYRDTTVLNAYDHIVLDWENGMRDNAYIRDQAEQDFTRARHRAWIQSLRTVVNPEACQLLSFHDIKKLLKPVREKYMGMKAVPIDSIVGSEDRYQDFSRHFFPKKEHLRQRWMSIDRAHLSDLILPPIKLLKIGNLYFVRDGNHRVSVARSQGVTTIDAEVIELSAEVQIDKDATRGDILKAVVAWERQRVLDQTGLERIVPVEMIEFTALGRWHEMLNHIEGHKYFISLERDNEISFEDAARSWYNSLYTPILEIVRNENLISRFPGRTEADLYIWIIKHWHSLKEQYGPGYPLDKAASEYAASHGKGPLRRLFRGLRKLLGIG